MSRKVLGVQCRKCHNTIPLTIEHGIYCPNCKALMVVAKYSEDKNILTPIDLLVYSLAQEYLSMTDEDGGQQAALGQALEGMSSNLRVLLH